MMLPSVPILAWHFTDGPKLRDGRPLEVRTYRHRGKLLLCQSGLHASVRAIDALAYASGSWVSRVECSGDIQQDRDELVCSVRRVLWFADATEALWEFTRAQAEIVRKYLERSKDIRDAAWDAAAWAAWAAWAAANLDLERRLLALEPTP